MINAQQVQGSWNQIRGKLKEKWGQLTDDDLKIVGGNVEQMVGRIQQKTGEMRETIESYVNDLLDQGQSVAQRTKATASQYAQQATEKAREGYQQASEQARQAYGSAERMVRQRPAESVAAVFGAGLIAGVVVGLMLHYRD
jgi:uncharacterized protein YjbJ (UPF0337 family)